MSKRFTKIICAAVAAISVTSIAFLPACNTKWGGVSGDKDVSTTVSSNGGFLVETGDDSNGYVYFINGKVNNKAYNNFGSVLKGSVQRIKKTDLNAGNYADTQTVVPSAVYANSDNLNAGIYIYGGYIYYATPSTKMNSEGEVLNNIIEFKRTKLDGTDTSDALWSSSDSAVNYRFVEVDGTVYILYALSENLYGTSATNIHSVNCSTGKNTILAYNVDDYKFDSVDATNPYVYYTMCVSQYLGGTEYDYNQVYMVRADAKSSPREYDLSDAEDSKLKYINYGMHVFDGIGALRYNSGDVTQFNYAYGSDTQYTVTNADITYSLKWYKDGVLYYTSQTSDNNVTFHSLEIGAVDSNNDGKVDAGWNAMTSSGTLLVSSNVTTEYEYVTLGDELYAINATSGGVTKSKVENGKIGDAIYVTEDSASTILEIRKEADGHTYLYYSVTGGNGYTINRVAIDGTEDDYIKLPVPSVSDDGELVYDKTYEKVKILDLDACSDWYKPEFVGEKLFFASETNGMSNYNYIMVCDLKGANGVMSNTEIEALNEKYKAVTEKIEKYDEKENADGTAAYNHLSSALKYLFHTGDVDYIDELINAYVKIEGKDKEYVYSEASVKIYKDYAVAAGDWEEYKEEGNSKIVNGARVYANSKKYYYTVVGRMTDSDAKGLKEHFKSDYMEKYPVAENKTWWDKLSTGGKFGTVFGIVEGCMLVIGGGIILGYYLISRKKAGGSNENRNIKVDLTDDRELDVYGDENGEKGTEKE